MHTGIKIDKGLYNLLIETFEFTDEQLAAIDYQIPMTQEIYDSVLNRCMELGTAADDLFYRMLLEYPDFLSVYAQKIVSAKYSCGFPDPQVLPIIVVDRYLDYFTTIMEDRLWQVLAKPVFRWRNRSGLSMNAARAA